MKNNDLKMRTIWAFNVLAKSQVNQAKLVSLKWRLSIRTGRLLYLSMKCGNQSIQSFL